MSGGKPKKQSKGESQQTVPSPAAAVETSASSEDPEIRERKKTECARWSA